MGFRIAHIGFLMLAVIITACAGMKPVTLNSFTGAERADTAVALIRKVSTGLKAIDGVAIPTRPEEGNRSYYRDIRVLPGRHTLDLYSRWASSVTVSASGYIEGSQSLTVELEAGHVYELHSDRTHGSVRLFFWIEDKTANTVVAGTKYGGSGNKALAQLSRSSDDTRIVLLTPRFDLQEHDLGASKAPRADWNETGKALAIRNIDSALAGRGILTVADDGIGAGSGCLPDTEIGLAPACGGTFLDKYHADYGMFLEVHDYYSSPRMVKARAIGMLVLFPYAPLMLPAMVIRDEGSAPAACVSLIDFRSGDVVWRRCINPRTNFTPDWRDDGSAKSAVQHLLRDFPAV